MSNVVVISSCTARKAGTTDGGRLPAELLYSGQQHVRLMQGVRRYREAGAPTGYLDLRILSALHGLLASRELVAPYDFSFAGLSGAAIRRHAGLLRIPTAVSSLLQEPAALNIVLLSEPYLLACDLSPELSLGGPTVVFCSAASAERLPKVPLLRAVLLTNREAQRFSCGLTALKGEIGGRILSGLCAGGIEVDEIVEPAADVLALLDKPSAPAQLRLAA